ncbi:MAG: MFS transporter [Gammaproteobacteria bacterium]|nr:MFS transporter [Gammaproteobacteria bacterium]
MTDAADHRIEIKGPRLLALTALMLLSFSALIAMPFNISGIVGSFEISNAAAGLVATVEMAAVALSSLLFSQLAPRLQPRTVYAVALAVIVVMNLATILAPSVAVLYFTRACAGAAAGAVVATVMSIAGRSTAPETTFGVINSCVGVMGMMLALLLPQALKLHLVSGEVAMRPADGLYLVYLGFALLAMVFIRLAPVPPPVPVARPDAPAISPLPLYGWLALLGLGILFFGHALLAVFIVEVGLAVPLTAEVIGVVFLFGSAFGVVAPLAAGWLGTRFKAAIPVTVILLAIIVFGLLLAAASTPWQFYLVGPFYAMMPIALMPFTLGALSRVDPSGRLAGAHPAFVMLGSAAAPLSGGAIRDFSGDFIANGWVMALCVVIGAALLARTVITSDRLRSPAVPARPVAVAGTPH